MQTKKLILSLLFSFLFITQVHSWPIPDTGLTKCYDNEKEIPCPKPGEPFYGQDGNYNINPPSYTKLDENGNDLPDDAETWVMVRDNVTGLIWEVKNNKDDVKDYSNPHDADNEYTWYDSNPETNAGNPGTEGDDTDTQDFIAALNNSSFGGASDWRLPDMYELLSIEDYFKTCIVTGCSFINNVFFPKTMSWVYWSSTSYAGDTDDAWSVSFNGNYDNYEGKYFSYYVRAVRRGQCRLFDNLVINKDNTVTDLSTGLMWYQETHKKYSWSEALSVCENSFLSEYSDWRLPTQKELRSIVSFQRYAPAVNMIVFPDTMSAFYWSSTSIAFRRDDAWGVDFNNGSDYNHTKDLSYYVRPVRGGQLHLFGHLIISSPNQASSWETGDTMPIRWDPKYISDNVRISLSRKGGKEDTFSLISETPNNGEFDWVVQGYGSVNCMLKIEPVNASDKFTQQGLFMITDFVPQNLSSSHSINICTKDQTIDIEWTAPEVWGRKIDGYSLKWDNSPDTLPDKSITATSLTHTSPSLEEGSDHYVHIRVVDDQGHWGNIAAHLGPFCIGIPIPEGFKVSNSQYNQVELAWNHMGNDLKYNVYKSLSQNGSYIRCNTIELNETQFVDTDVVENTQYWYKIKSVNTFGEESLFSDAISITTPDHPIYTLKPEGLLSTSHSINVCNKDQTINIEWTAPEVLGIVMGGYSVKWDQSPNTLPDKNITTSNLNHISPYLRKANDHYVHVRIVDDQGKWSKVAAHLGPFCIEIPIPEGFKVSNSQYNKVELAWNHMGNDLKYNVYKSLSQNGSYTRCNTIELNETQFMDTDVVENTQYWYKIKSVNTFGEESLFSDAISITTPDHPIYTLKPEGLLSTSHSINVCNKDQTINIEWTAPEVLGIVMGGYSVKWDQSPNTLPDKNITTSNLNHISPYLRKANDHYVHVRIVDDQGKWSKVAAHLGPFCIEIPIPEGFKISNSQYNKVELAWNHMGNDLKYNLYKSLSQNGSYTRCNTIELNETQFVDTDVVENTQYWYKIKCVNTFEEEGLFSDAISITTPHHPINNIKPEELTSKSHLIHVCNKNQTIVIEWTAPEVLGIVMGGYSVKWDHLPDTVPDKIITTKNSYHISPELSEANDHYVHIRVVDDQGHWSHIAAHLGPFCIDLPDVPIPAGIDISNNSQQIELTWWYMGGLKYNVYKSDSENGFFIKCDPYELTEPKFVDTDVVEGIQYWYKIKAVNDLGESLFSDAVSAKIEPVEGGSFKLISHRPYQMQLSGSSATYQIQLISEGGYSDDVVLSINDLPASFLKATFNNNLICPPGFAILTVNIFDNIPEKQYSFNVSALGHNRLEEIPLFLDVKDPPSEDSVISTYVSHSQVNLHQSFEIYGNLAPKGINTPISIYVQHESEQSPTILHTKTDQNKSYKTSYTPDKIGQYRIYARWESDGELNASESSPQSVKVYRGKSRLTCQTPNTNVNSDNEVQVIGKLLMPSLGDAQIILKIKDPDGNIDWVNRYTEIDGSYSYSIKLEKQGIWEISSCWEGNEQYIGSESYPLRLYPGLKAGKALIVAGGGIANNTLWPTIQYLTTQFYKALLKRHFTQQMIYYISPDINHQNDEIVINDNTPQVSDIETHIKSLYENVSQQDVNSERPFILYMADHGGSQTFKVNNGLEILKAIDLDSWLDDLQLHTNCPVFVILEACYSGSFVDVLLPSTGQKRVILTSAGGNDQSISDNDGRSSFSRFLFNELSAGNNLYESFDKATAKMENVFLFNKQRPQIEDGNNGEVAKTSYIGGTFLIADILPEIVNHTPMQTFSAGSHELFMVISDVEGIDHAWVSIMAPNFTIPESSNDFETPIINLPQLDLTDQGNGRYSAAYENFNQNGVYHVTFNCEDIGGNVVSEEVLLNVIDGSIPGDLDTNGRITLSDAIISMQSIAGLAVSVSDNSRILCNGVVDTCEVIEILQMMAGVE